jgi:hypothetical protein
MQACKKTKLPLLTSGSGLGYYILPHLKEFHPEIPNQLSQQSRILLFNLLLSFPCHVLRTMMFSQNFNHCYLFIPQFLYTLLLCYSIHVSVQYLLESSDLFFFFNRTSCTPFPPLLPCISTGASCFRCATLIHISLPYSLIVHNGNKVSGPG